MTRASNSKRVHTSCYDDMTEKDDENAEPQSSPPISKRTKTSAEITTVATIAMDEGGNTPACASVEVHRQKLSASASRVLDDRVRMHFFNFI